MPQRTCSVEECDRPCFSRGQCSKHYARWYKEHCAPCEVDGCDKPGVARSMCVMHYSRWRKHGDPFVTKVPQRGTCTVDGCDRPHEARGLCHLHYKRQPEQRAKARARALERERTSTRWTPETLALERERCARRRRRAGVPVRPRITPAERAAKRKAARLERARRRLARAAAGTRGTRVWTAGLCASCRKPFVGSVSCFVCSKLCRRRLDRKLRRDAYGNHRERAKHHGVPYESVKRVDIFERDGYRCQLCGKKTRGAHWVRAGRVNPHAPTLDHIIPMACGGAHVYSNLQCACFACNSAKGDRAANEQLLLGFVG